jgi:hypothetical protein
MKFYALILDMSKTITITQLNNKTNLPSIPYGRLEPLSPLVSIMCPY